MKDLQIAFMVSTNPEPKQVSETSCSSSCLAKFILCHEQIDSLVREIEDLKYDGYTLMKSQKPLNQKAEAQTKVFKKNLV